MLRSLFIMPGGNRGCSGELRDDVFLFRAISPCRQAVGLSRVQAQYIGFFIYRVVIRTRELSWLEAFAELHVTMILAAGECVRMMCIRYYYGVYFRCCAFRMLSLCDSNAGLIMTATTVTGGAEELFSMAKKVLCPNEPIIECLCLNI